MKPVLGLGLGLDSLEATYETIEVPENPPETDEFVVAEVAQYEFA